MPIRSFARFAAFVAAIAPITAALAGQDLLWQTPYIVGPNFDTSDSVVHAGQFPRDREVADDFNATGFVETVVAPGGGCFFCDTPHVLGAIVRFYEWTSNGPGALQQETFVGLNDGFTYMGNYPGQLTINLPKPFQASGWHFVSVQVNYGPTGGMWDLIQANRGMPINATVHSRNNLGDGVWRPDVTQNGAVNADFVITLYGQAGAVQPTIAGVSRPTVTGSDRIIITGQDFGAPGDGEVLVNGLPAIVREWLSTKIIAYVPEGVAPGVAQLTVTNLGLVSEPTPLTIMPREPNGKIEWVFEADAEYTSFPPAIGPNGNLYFSDIDANLYAMTADGALLWIVDAALGQQANGDETAVSVGTDGTIYVATNPLGPTLDLVAFNPDGTHKWTFTAPLGEVWAAGPTLGPDGRVYAAMSNAQQLGLAYDVVAIGPDGLPDWTAAANPPVFDQAPTEQTIVFGPSSAGGAIDQALFVADRLGDGRIYGFRIADGQQLFATFVNTGNEFNQNQLAINEASGDFYMIEFTAPGGSGWGLQMFEPDGDRGWRYDPDIDFGATRPIVGADGVVYFGWDLSRLTALSPDNDHLWTKMGALAYETPGPSPTDPLLIAVGRRISEQASMVEARSAVDGELLWSQDLLDDSGDDVVAYTRPEFSTDGRSAYFAAIEPVLTNTNVFRLFAVAAGGAACLGDVDGDGEVGFGDLNLLLGQYGQSGEGLAGDADGDGDVDFNDLNLLLGVYGEAC